MSQHQLQPKVVCCVWFLSGSRFLRASPAMTFPGFMRPSNDPSARHFWSLIKGGSWGNFLSTVQDSKSKRDRLEVANMGRNCPSPAISTVSSESANSFPTGSLRLSWDSNSYVLPSDVFFQRIDVVMGPWVPSHTTFKHSQLVQHLHRRPVQPVQPGR